jgi:hypothetical protein
MNIAFALDYIPRRMQELGHADHYVTRYRHVRVEDKTTVTIKAHNQLLLFISPEANNLRIKSSRGFFNLTDYTINEQQHEHSGVVEIHNDTGQNLYALFIQVIPKNKTKSQ